MNELDIVIGQEIDPAGFILRNPPAGSFRNIVIKPNWVKHCEHPEFPIEALVTSSRPIDECIEACLKNYRGLEKSPRATSPSKRAIGAR